MYIINRSTRSTSQTKEKNLRF